MPIFIFNIYSSTKYTCLNIIAVFYIKELSLELALNWHLKTDFKQMLRQGHGSVTSRPVRKLKQTDQPSGSVRLMTDRPGHSEVTLPKSLLKTISFVTKFHFEATILLGSWSCCCLLGRESFLLQKLNMYEMTCQMIYTMIDRLID